MIFGPGTDDVIFGPAAGTDDVIFGPGTDDVVLWVFFASLVRQGW